MGSQMDISSIAEHLGMTLADPETGGLSRAVGASRTPTNKLPINKPDRGNHQSDLNDFTSLHQGHGCCAEMTRSPTETTSRRHRSEWAPTRRSRTSSQAIYIYMIYFTPPSSELQRMLQTTARPLIPGGGLDQLDTNDNRDTP